MYRLQNFLYHGKAREGQRGHSRSLKITAANRNVRKHHVVRKPTEHSERVIQNGVKTFPFGSLAVFCCHIVSIVSGTWKILVGPI